MSNSRLYDKNYKVPTKIINHIKSVLVSNPSGDGVKRAKHIINNGSLTYSAMKRLKNFFDYFNKEKQSTIQYELAGGDLMKSFVETTLNSDRKGVEMEDNIRIGRDDVRKDVKLTTKASNIPRLNENKINRSSVCVIVNQDNEFLLVKRSNHSGQWMPNKWALVGGKIEEDETPERACVREIKEEVGLEITKLLKRFVIQRSEDNVEYVFATRYDGDPENVSLNPEHTEYGWFSYDEIYEMNDKVPNMMEYLLMSFKKYE